MAGLDVSMPDYSPPTPSQLGSWQLWRQVCRLRLAEQASADVTIQEEEMEKAWQDFCQRNGVDAVKAEPVPRQFAPCSPSELRSAVARDMRIARWKESTFGLHAKERFQQHKATLDRVVYSLLRVRDLGLARELWFRLKENEATFAELAPLYTEGHELHTSGLLGPALFGRLHPALAAHLRAGEEGKLLQPVAIGDLFVIARVEKFLPAEFDQAMKMRMSEELCLEWLESKLDESAVN